MSKPGAPVLCAHYCSSAGNSQLTDALDCTAMTSARPDHEPDPPLTGGCGCGRIRWELSAPPSGARYCHCTRCQRRTGTAASPGAQVVPGSFRVTSGEELIGAWCPEGGFEKHFCVECGSALFSRDPDDHAVVMVRLGSFDGDPGVRPSARQFVDSACVWERIPDDGLTRHGGRAPR